MAQVHPTAVVHPDAQLHAPLGRAHDAPHRMPVHAPFHERPERGEHVPAAEARRDHARVDARRVVGRARHEVPRVARELVEHVVAVRVPDGRAAEAAAESKAGYEIVSKQTAPTVSWLKTAREDLAAAYDVLDRPEEAAKYRAEAARLAQK